MSVHSRRTNGAPPSADQSLEGGSAALDGEAVEALVVTHQGAVRGFLRYLGCPRAHVDALVQETFLTFLSARFEERDDRATARYLRSIARHLFLKSLRRLDRDPPSVDLDAAETVWSEFQEDAGGAPYLDALRRCLTGVTGRTKDALELRYAGNLGRAAIAQRLQLSESGVHSILVRARRRLRECVERRLGA